MESVYLAGAITGWGYGDATNWREHVRANLNPGIVGLSPLRAKEYLKNETAIGDSYEQMEGHDTPLSSSRGIMTRDFYDCRKCDMVMANLLGTETVSIGTVMEIAWAYALNKPLVLVLEDNNIHEHSMIREATGFRVKTIDEAISIVNAVLTDYTGKS